MVNSGPLPKYGSRKVRYALSMVDLVQLTIAQDRNFADQIIKTMTSQSKLCEIGLVCALDICRAAARVKQPCEEISLLVMAADVALEVKVCLESSLLYPLLGLTHLSYRLLFLHGGPISYHFGRL